MSSRTLLSLALALLVAGLTWYLYGSSGTPAVPQPPPLSVLDPARIQLIELQRPGQPALRLERAGEAWHQRSPLAFPADNFKVSTLLSMLHAPARRLQAAGGDDAWSELGLAPPRAVARFDDTVIEIGDTEPVSGERYVALGKQVMLLADSWYTHLFATPQRWLDPRPLGGAAGLEAMVFDQASWRLKDGQWQRTPAHADRTHDDGARLAEAWSEARALAVSALDDNLPWSERVMLELAGDAQDREFRISRVQRMVFLARDNPPLQYQFSERQSEKLLPAPLTKPGEQ